MIDLRLFALLSAVLVCVQATEKLLHLRSASSSSRKAYDTTFCAKGKFASSPPDAQATCIACDPGTYNPSFGSTSSSDCISCTQGSVTDTLASPGATSCTPCKAGSYSAFPTQACQPCREGYVTNKPTDGASNCVGTCKKEKRELEGRKKAGGGGGVERSGGE